MQLCSRFLLLAVFVALAHAGTASGQVLSERYAALDRLICEAPISPCSFGPEHGGDLLTLAHPVRRDDCPLGYSRACVPSCPQCDDCDAQVCLPDSNRECDTACDCQPSLGCFDNRCIAGFAPVFCCDSDTCPAGQQCQRRDGEFRRCKRDPGDPTCRERIERVTRKIRNVVEHNSRCRDDSDCVAISTRTECVGTCGAFVNRTRARRVEHKINRLDRRICGDFEEDGCPFEPVACPAVVLQPGCRDHHCTGVLRQLDPRQ